MSWITSETDARFVAILESARGADGSLGSGAQARAIAAGAFRRVPDGAPLDDPACTRELADRGYEVHYDGWADDPSPANPLDGSQVVRLPILLKIGWAYGRDGAAFAATAGAETKTADVLATRSRAVAESWRAVRAVTFPDLVKSSSTPVAILTCQAAGPTTLQDTGRGYLMSVSPLEVWLSIDTTAAHTPGA